jgi:hypothetical protein
MDDSQALNLFRNKLQSALDEEGAADVLDYIYLLLSPKRWHSLIGEVE